MSRVKKFFSYYRPYQRLLLADLLCALIVAATALVFPLCARYITKTVLERGADNALTQIYLVGGVMLTLIVIHALCNFFVDYQGHKMGALMERDMRAELFDHYQGLSFSFFDNHKVGQLMNRLTNDTFWMGELYHHGPEDTVLTAAKFVGTFVILVNINAPLTLVVFLFFPPMAVCAFYFNRRMSAALRRSKNRVGDINAQVEDTLAGIRVVKSFTNELTEQTKFRAENNRFLESRKDAYRSEAYMYNGVVAFTQLFTAAIVVFGGASILRGSLDLADLVTYLLYIGILTEPIRTALNFAVLYQEGMTGFDRFMDALEVQPGIRDAENALELRRVRGAVSFRDVSFAYPKTQEPVFQGLSLDIQAGEFVALVGASGVGKTTLCSLIPRFYDVSGGEVLIDGQNVRGLALRSLREHIGVVQQDVYLFSGTVFDNIAYGKPGASRAEVIAAAKSAHAHDFIMRLPGGYSADIGQRGVKLSGGQKQRLSTARVFLKNPPILIFDEATSSLDAESERAVQDSLERLSRTRTTLVVAHRLSTVRHAERIIVLGERGIAEQGNHKELIAMNGVYAALHRAHLRL